MFLNQMLIIHHIDKSNNDQCFHLSIRKHIVRRLSRYEQKDQSKVVKLSLPAHALMVFLGTRYFRLAPGN